MIGKGAPGSTWWLLRHEIRMVFAAMRKVRANGKIGARWLGPTFLVVLHLALHGVAFTLIPELHRQGPATALAAMLATAAVLVGVTLMLAAALRGSVSALFERGDLDLLLSSPLPTASIFFTRLLGLVVSVAGAFLYFLAPFANVGLLTGHPEWLALYVVVFALALLVSSGAMLLTLVLVRLIGARRTKVLVQVLSAIAGALVFLLSQAANVHGAMGERLKWLVHGDWSGVLWLGHAALGRPLPLAALLAAGVALFFFTTRTTRGFFASGVQQAAGAGRAAAAPRGGPRLNFTRGLVWTTMVKEWRLIGRDTRLITQVLMRLLYMVPLGFIVFKNADTISASAGAAIVFVCASMAGSLAWITIAAEDAPDLLASAPRSAAVIEGAKVAAATVPPLALVVLPALWLLVHRPLAGLAVLLTLLCGAVASATIILWNCQPGKRSDFNQRSGRGVGGLLQSLSSFAWAATVWLLLMGMDYAPMLKWSPLALGAALLILGVAWAVRQTRQVRVRRQLAVTQVKTA
ncbi:hypothetical protein ASF61_04760 [Duganella sp. Leaf126]|uniref:hypothetical protein n=1 Tax=Duganella sp. Leaf126 TaxID=1736266 RepID=UPI0006F8A124|nr:hypothetical protein [Duganella sp. Leaf126]KQQ40109.1 hypothetical protein ASF61_04760 [Duganella sp. Leaf126]